MNLVAVVAPYLLSSTQTWLLSNPESGAFAVTGQAARQRTTAVVLPGQYTFAGSSADGLELSSTDAEVIYVRPEMRFIIVPAVPRFDEDIVHVRPEPRYITIPPENRLMIVRNSPTVSELSDLRVARPEPRRRAH
jgi:hypothetical protein